MKRLLFASAAVALICAACGQKTEEPAMGEIDDDVTMVTNADIMTHILSARHSVRRYGAAVIDPDVLKAVLWAANGVNRIDGSHKRTAPSAVNAQDIELYALTDDGAYHYQAIDSTLVKISDTDIRPMIAGRNDFILDQLTILLCSDQSKFDARFGDRAMTFGAMDAGYVSQNICLYCAAAGLATVPCAPPIDAEAVQSALGLPKTMMPLIYHPVGVERE